MKPPLCVPVIADPDAGAIAIEAGTPFPLKHLNEVSARVPYLCKVAPAGKYHMEDVFRAYSQGFDRVLNEGAAAA